MKLINNSKIKIRHPDVGDLTSFGWWVMTPFSTGINTWRFGITYRQDYGSYEPQSSSEIHNTVLCD
jgi:hypothetical protein